MLNGASLTSRPLTPVSVGVTRTIAAVAGRTGAVTTAVFDSSPPTPVSSRWNVAPPSTDSHTSAGSAPRQATVCRLPAAQISPPFGEVTK